MTAKKNNPHEMLSQTYPPQRIEEIKASFRRMEKLELDNPDHVLSSYMRIAWAYHCLAMTGIAYSTPKQYKKIMSEAERLCNLFGTSLEKRESIERCLTKKHQDCLGDYVSTHAVKIVVCKCACHRK